MTIRVLLDINFDETDEQLWGFHDKESKEWFDNEVMKPETLFLHSNEVGDTIGEIVKASYFILPKQDTTHGK